MIGAKAPFSPKRPDMKRTLLQVTQSYLNRTDGFYVDSIFDTDESQQVALIAEEVYYNMTNTYPNLLYVQKDMNLDALSDLTRPNYLLIPESILRIQESKFWYNTARDDLGQTVNYSPVKYVTPLEFNEMTAERDDRADNTQVVESHDGTKLVIFNNKFPEYCTSFDGVHLVFDSYHSDYDDTLQASKSKVVATEEPVFLQSDDFVIPIPNRLSEVYLDNVLAECYSSLRQEDNVRISQRARRGLIKIQQDSRQIGSGGRPKKRLGRGRVSTEYRSRGI